MRENRKVSLLFEATFQFARTIRQRSAALFHKAARILLFAGDPAATLAAFLAHHLTILGLAVMSATSWGRIMHLARNSSKDDLVVASSFRKGLRLTVEGLQPARKQGAYCIGITDTCVSPIAQSSDKVFLASIAAPPFGASYFAHGPCECHPGRPVQITVAPALRQFCARPRSKIGTARAGIIHKILFRIVDASSYPPE